MRGVLCLLLVVMVAAGASAGHKPCVKQCPHPTGPFGSYLCCDESPGKCPFRPSCPPGFPTRKLPGFKVCHFDPECPHPEKCCFDACLKKKVCKPADH